MFHFDLLFPRILCFFVVFLLLFDHITFLIPYTSILLHMVSILCFILLKTGDLQMLLFMPGCVAVSCRVCFSHSSFPVL